MEEDKTTTATTTEKTMGTIAEPTTTSDKTATTESEQKQLTIEERTQDCKKWLTAMISHYPQLTVEAIGLIIITAGSRNFNRCFDRLFATGAGSEKELSMLATIFKACRNIADEKIKAEEERKQK